jgi:DNA modification methylase
MSHNSVNHPGAAQPEPTGPSTVADSHGPKSASNLQSPPGKRNDLQRDLTFVDVPIEKIRIAEQRVRKPSNRQVSRVKRSIETFGVCRFPLLDQSFLMIDGHAIVEAARQLGLNSLRCIILQDCTELERRALSIALNRLQERGEWDEQVLRLEYQYLLESNFDLTLTGFEISEIDRVLVLDDIAPDEADPVDRVGELPAFDGAAVSRPGDIWELGSHKAMCGNARSPDDLAAVTGDQIISAVFTDPPYNVPVNGHVRAVTGKFEEFAEGSGEMSGAEYEAFSTTTAENMAKALKQGGILFLCIDWRHVDVQMRVLRGLGLELINFCVWGKDKPGMGSLYRSQHEIVLVAKRPGAPHRNNVQLGAHGRNRSNLWRYAGATGGRKSEEDDFSLHPTVKPVQMVRDAILDVTALGEVVLDPFLGSGTTLLAAERAHRVCVGLEISPAYVDVAVRRWEKMTGLEARLMGTGQTFSEVRAERGGESTRKKASPWSQNAGTEDF